MESFRWDQLHEGQSANFAVTLVSAHMDMFRELSGDCNPLHTEPAFAAESGFRDVVAFGMLTSSFYSQLVGCHLPGRFCVLHGIDVEFVAPAFVGDQLTVSGSICHKSDAVRRLEIRARIVNQDEKMISRAKIRVGVHGS